MAAVSGTNVLTITIGLPVTDRLAITIHPHIVML
jgi:hypothetical protein